VGAGGRDPTARVAGGTHAKSRAEQPTGNCRSSRGRHGTAADKRRLEDGCFRFKACRGRAGRRISNEGARAVRFAPHALKAVALFAWLISHQPAVLLSQNKPATSNQPAVLFSQNKPAPAISHQPTEQEVWCWLCVRDREIFLHSGVVSLCLLMMRTFHADSWILRGVYKKKLHFKYILRGTFDRIPNFVPN
jgi:hypothetical protein